ncbi:class I SAM-dependent methyltransferase [Ruminiclostridium cellobioparum]|uniref:Methyltransferase family protein n=1 Tax=Ruminiclostridium cellobioparum subsp. termitidis CT1112 TaxID=1195236 RepID=S0FQ99_RUMCE|nr:class I SAM-dependent methyltransferase [Ruminiclostridium cellobioparum]EMS70668.1 methyltransferase family protein [Ruminiclostridium cellobioparum subsp. termitidis CT1112]
MEFYKQISKYYDYIFPAGEEQVKFIKEVAGNPPRNLLDIACGTGGYSLELAAQGYNVTAVDQDAGMLEQLDSKMNGAGGSLNIVQADMLGVDEKLSAKFNMAFCIGNSLVHLENLQQIKEFLASVKNTLESDGSLVLQIINFDRILLREIKSLPTIENKSVGLTFERNYDYNKQDNTIAFNTRLTVEGKSLDNQVTLYPLRQDELTEALSQAGFKKLRLFADFNGNEFDKYNSFMLVLWARQK